jgi:hypothetical protein
MSKVRREEFSVSGDQLLNKIKELVHEGNVRRILVKHEGKTVVEFPLSAGIIGVLLAPQLAAIGVIGALLAKCTIEVERQG